MDRESARGSAYAYNAMATTHGWAAYCDHTLDFHWTPFEDLREIWNRARAGECLPRRTAMTARLLKDYLRCIAIYERFVDDKGVRRYRARLVGTGYAQVYGELTGKVVDEIVSGEKLLRFHLALDQTLKSSAPLRIIAAAEIPDKSFLSAEYFLAPLADDAGIPSMVLICAHFSGERPWVEYFADARARIAAREAAH
jgi:hypothetical protein